MERDQKSFIDLRSDTFTQPTAEMRLAMFEAEVGDMVHGEDPTVTRLEELSARMVGKEAALFMPSGTMSNLAAALAHCNRGDEVILGDMSHILWWEVGHFSALGGLVLRAVRNDKHGMLDLEEIKQTIRPANVHFPRTGLICVENSHNNCGGTVLRPQDMEAVETIGRDHSIPVHLDGSRIFNAATALDVPASELAQHADSLCFCLSKGLSAPVGSMLCGDHAFVVRARRYRQMLGVGMRQAGILAAAGIVALESMVERLALDNANARFLAEGLASIPEVDVDLSLVRTNLVYVRLKTTPSDHFVNLLQERHILAFAVPGERVRFALSRSVAREDVERVIQVARELLPEGKEARSRRR